MGGGFDERKAPVSCVGNGFNRRETEILGRRPAYLAREGQVRMPGTCFALEAERFQASPELSDNVLAGRRDC